MAVPRLVAAPHEQLDIGLVTNDVYSHSVDGQAWQPTLLRSPKMAWGGGRPGDLRRTRSAHRPGCSPLCHRARARRRLATDDLTEAAQRQAQPLIVFDRYEGMDRPAWGPVPPRGLWGAAMLRNVAKGRVADPGPGHDGGLFKRPATATTPADECA